MFFITNALGIGYDPPGGYFITNALGIGYDSPVASDLKLLNVAAIVTTVLLKLMLSLQVQWEICIRNF